MADGMPPFHGAGEAAALAAALVWAGSVTVYRGWGRPVPPAALNLLNNRAMR